MRAFLDQPVTIGMVTAFVGAYLIATGLKAFMLGLLGALFRSQDEADEAKKLDRDMKTWRDAYHREFFANTLPSTLVNQTEIRDN